MELALAGNNLYAAGFVVEFDEEEGLLLRNKLELLGSPLDRYHTVMMDQMLDYIAWEKYKDTVEDASKYWWVIADANEIQNPLDLTEFVGKDILIPNILNVLLLLQ